MQVWKEDFEQLLFVKDIASGLKAVIVIHNTTLGPALGGCRLRNYAAPEEAVRDALRLARGMTYKSALSGVPYGGGKAVIYEVPPAPLRAAAFRALGEFIQGLGGQYITGLDLGTTVTDMDEIRLATEFVTDTTGSLGASGALTATMTAYGVFLGIQASLEHLYGSDSMEGKRVAVQGLGKVGTVLCKYLNEAGANLIVSDVDESRVEWAVRTYGAIAVKKERIYETVCDVFAPCALGGILNDDTIPLLRCRIVAGAANNQLGEEHHAQKLHERGILYAPDYVINAGGIIVTGAELDGRDAAFAKIQVEKIGQTLREIYADAESMGIIPVEAANQRTEQRLAGRKP